MEEKIGQNHHNVNVTQYVYAQVFLEKYFVEKIMYQKIFSFEIHGNKTQEVFIDSSVIFYIIDNADRLHNFI